MATATDATATPYLNSSASCRSRRLCASPLRRHQTGRELLPAVAETGSAWRCLAGSRCASQRRRPRHACSGERYALHNSGYGVSLCNASFAATGKRIRQLPIGDQLKGVGRGGLENQSLALNSTIPAEPAACEAFRRGAAHYERLPHALDAPRGASRTGRVARAEMRSAEERSRARLWSSKAPHARRPVAANHNTGVSTPIKASTREAGVVVAGL